MFLVGRHNLPTGQDYYQDACLAIGNLSQLYARSPAVSFVSVVFVKLSSIVTLSVSLADIVRIRTLCEDKDSLE